MIRPHPMTDAPTDVLVLTAPTGAGHDSVATAIAEALHECDSEVRVRVLNPLSGGPSHGLLPLGRWYDATAAHAPWLWGLFFHATDNAWAVGFGEAAGALLWGRGLRSVVQAERPRIVVAVHPLCTRLAARVLRPIPAAPPLHCVATDLVTLHRYWACERVDAYYVATPDAGEALVAQGVARDRVHVTGLPLRASFARALPLPVGAAPARVLVLGGGHPSRPLETLVRALAGSCPRLQMVVVCGRNARLRQRLARLLGAQVTVLGWRDDIAALMRWSTLVITRAGSVSLAEAFSQARPVAIYQALPGQEDGNVTLVERVDAGRWIADAGAVGPLVAALTDAPYSSKAPPPAWWAGAARRVAACLLAARADVQAGSRQPPHSPDPPAPGRHVIDNPVNGERIVICQSGAETGGQVLAFELFLPAGAQVPARHAHPVQQEQFTVLAGRMRFRLGRRTLLVHAGETVLVPAGTAHWFGNCGLDTAHLHVEVRPALRMEEVFESAAAMGRASHIFGTRLPRPTDLALFLTEFERELAVPDLPAPLVRAVLAPFAWLARRRRDQALPRSA